MKIFDFLKKSIKWRLTCIFVIVMVCCIGSILLFNTLFLEKLYINQRKDILKQTYSIIDDGIMEVFEQGSTLTDLFNKPKYYFQPVEGPGNEIRKQREYELNKSNETTFSRMLRELQAVYNISVVFVDEKNNKYSIFSNNQRFDEKINSYLFDTNVEEEKNFKILEQNPDYKIALNNKWNIFYRRISKAKENPKSKVKINLNTKNKNVSTNRDDADIELFGHLSDNVTFVYMTTPLMSIREPIKLFNNVLILVSMIIIVVGSIIIYFTSSKLAKPIVEMANISKKMSNMDFNSKYQENRVDEIGLLGENINEMSNKLEKSIAELKNANIMLKADVEQKEKLDNMRTEFIASVSHELKTPIALIQGYAEGLESGVATSKEDQDFYSNVIKEEAEKMNKMVMQLLNLMELEKDIDDVVIERINLYEIVKGVIDAQGILLDNADVNLDLNINKNIFVWADEFKLEEVITNYMTNAIHHVDENKLIKVYTKERSEQMISFCVFNTTKALTEEQIENLWEKFYKVDKARTRAYGGTGLGLSIVKAISKKLGTSCGCQNVDNGIEFYFDLAIK